MLTRSIIGLIMLLGVVIPLDAQLVHKYGFKGGVTISNIKVPNLRSFFRTGTPVIPDENIVNPFFGVFLESGVVESIPVQLEVFYTRMGAGHTLTILVTTEQSPETPEYYIDFVTEIGLHYLVVGLTARPGLSLGSTTLYARIGPTLNYLFAMTNLAEFDNSINRYLLGYQAGLGFQIDGVLEHAFAIEVTHSRNFNYFYKTPYGDFYNVSWFLTMGISI